MALDEFGLIRQYFDWPPQHPATVRGVGDDAALLTQESSQQLVITTDTLLYQRHFDDHISPHDLGWKSLAVSLSDLAAMAATPTAYTLALSLPALDTAWLSGFSQGLREATMCYAVDLVGGDTTRGPLAITITAMGCVVPGQALLRSGAQVGDAVWVSGTLGDAALALALGPSAPPELRSRLDRPEPRVEAASTLRDRLHAGLDVSDGLSSDLQHMLAASGVGACVEWDQLPRSESFRQAAASDEVKQHCLLHGGDDYELLVSAPSGHDLQRACPGTRWTRIGRIESTPGLRLDWGQGRVEPLLPAAWNHFA